MWQLLTRTPTNVIFLLNLLMGRIHILIQIIIIHTITNRKIIQLLPLISLQIERFTGQDKPFILKPFY